MNSKKERPTKVPKTRKGWKRLPIPQTQKVLKEIVSDMMDKGTSIEMISKKIKEEYDYPMAIIFHNVDIADQKFTGATAYAGSPKKKPRALHF